MSLELIPPSKTELEEIYKLHGSTISSLAKKYNTSNPTIRKWLISYGIERKSHKQASQEANLRNRSNIPHRNQLEYDYKTLSIKKLEEKYGVGQSTIYHWINELKIAPIEHKEACGKRIYKFHKRSKLEKTIEEFLIKNDPEGKWSSTNRTILSPMELDLISEIRKIALEICGVYWHSQNFGNKSSSYHRDKMIRCKEHGITLITIFDSDPIEYIYSLLNYKLKINQTKIMARKCHIKEISPIEANKFHDKFHAAKSCGGGSLHLGVYLNDELLQVMSFSSSRFSTNHQWELLRFTNQPNIVVIGGLSKLWNYFLKIANPDNVVTYANLRFGEGNSYLSLGFEYSHTSSPNYWYFHKSNSKKLFSRVMFQKHKLPEKLENFNVELTEWENMKNNGYDRIWDCGNAVYHWKK